MTKRPADVVSDVRSCSVFSASGLPIAQRVPAQVLYQCMRTDKRDANEAS